MRYKMILQYNGTCYSGWQRQKNGVSVQEELEAALSKLYGEEIKAVASGRTDAGVHAEGQVVHFDAPETIPAAKIPLALNNFLPDDISAVSAEKAADDFNARFSAKRKTYVYRMYISPVRLPLKDLFAVRISLMPDLEKMRAAARHIAGEHDFSAFLASGSVVKNTVRTVYSLEIAEKSGDIEITVEGNGFLYNMVRIIAGTLLYAGTGKIAPEEIPDILALGDRKRAGKTMPAKGLSLLCVEYD